MSATIKEQNSNDKFSIFKDIMKGYIRNPHKDMPPEYTITMVNNTFPRDQDDSWVRIDGTPVASYIGTKRGEDVAFKQFPVIPPFDRCWIETNTIQYEDGDHNGRMGVAVVRQPSGGFIFSTYRNFKIDKDDSPIPVMGVCYAVFDDNGMLADWQKMTPDIVGQFPKELQEAWDDALVDAVHLALTSFMFCHCKNIDLVERLPKRHEQREAKRRGEPILKYHEIVIDPKRSHATNETSANKATEPSVAFHLVRGHFAHYTEEKPLFGKYVGTYWVPAHARGSRKFGEVNSTYTVKPDDIDKAA